MRARDYQKSQRVMEFCVEQSCGRQQRSQMKFTAIPQGQKVRARSEGRRVHLGENKFKDILAVPQAQGVMTWSIPGRKALSGWAHMRRLFWSAVP